LTDTNGKEYSFGQTDDISKEKKKERLALPEDIGRPYEV